MYGNMVVVDLLVLEASSANFYLFLFFSHVKFICSEFACLISRRHTRIARENEIKLIGRRPKHEYSIFSLFSPTFTANKQHGKQLQISTPFSSFFFLWQRLNYTMVRGVEKASMNFRMVGELRRETCMAAENFGSGTVG